MRNLVIGLIRLYQKTMSPDHGFLISGSFNKCRFYPSCSEYSVRAVEKFGLFKGGFKALARILRCGPWSRGGVDPVRSKMPQGASADHARRAGRTSNGVDELQL